MNEIDFIPGQIYISTDTIFYRYIHKAKESKSEFTITTGILPAEILLVFIDNKHIDTESIHPYKQRLRPDETYLVFRIYSDIAEEILITNTITNRNFIAPFDFV